MKSSLIDVFIFASLNKVMAQKPSIPKGTRDFSPVEVQRRQYIMNTIKHHLSIMVLCLLRHLVLKIVILY